MGSIALDYKFALNAVAAVVFVALFWLPAIIRRWPTVPTTSRPTAQ